MRIVSLSNAPRVPIHLEGYKMHSMSSLDVIHLCLQPGQDMPQHPNQSDVVACLIKGEVTLNMGESKTRLSLYDSVK
jgi:quercetin dioxygenase-like cupin family protein